MKILWALLDVVAILILGSGLYLWFSRRRTGEDRVMKAHGANGAAMGAAE